MKKLLVVMLVLGMASIANAVVISLSGDALTQSGTVSVVVTGSTQDYYLAVVIDDPAALSNFLAGAAAPDMTGMVQTVTINGDDGEVWAFGRLSDPAYKDGTWLTADWSGATSYLTISLYETPDGTTYNLIDTSLVGIPEPVTMALLGIGSLFLLRRRK